MDIILPQIIRTGRFNSIDEFSSITVTNPRELKTYELELFTHDGGTSYINGQPHKIKKGNLLIARPKDIRYSKLHFCCRFIHFNTCDSSLLKILDSLPRFVETDCTNALKPTFLTVRESFMCGDNHNSVMARGALTQLLCQIKNICDGREFLNSQKENEEDSAEHNISKALCFMRNNFDKETDVPTLSAMCNLSPSAFYDKFKISLKTTPNAYLTELRIANAKKALIQTDSPMDIVAQESGFSSQAYFTYVFKKHTGISPLKYRNSAKYKL